MHLPETTLASVLLVGATSGLFAAPASVPPAAAQGDLVAVRAHKLHVSPGNVLEDATVLIRDGVIMQVGSDLTIPEGARLIEGDVVCAGFMDPWGSLGMNAAAVVDMGTNAATRATDGVDPYIDPWYRNRALAAGVTAVRVQAGMASVRGGVGAVLSTAPAADLESMILLRDSNAAAGLGLSARGKAPDVFARIGAVDKLVGDINSGRDYSIVHAKYAREMEAWNKAIAEAEAKLEKDFKKAKKDRDKEVAEAKEDDKEFKEEKYKEDKRPKPPKQDIEDAVMARVASGELPLVVTIHRAAEMRELLKGTAKFKRLRLVIAGGTEAEAVADQLAARSIPVIVRPIPLGANRPDEYSGHDLALAGRLADAGVRVLLGSSGGGSADLPLLATLAIGHGLDRDKALAALTTEVARTFDLSGELGSLRPGRRADLLVLDGEPLLPTTTVRYVLSGGRVLISPDSRD
ncbi:MAG: amidohydrolase family protein [Planctomycetota bacterium]|nr:amidohydrolase family protein [Planctomycetota bacterium]